MKISKNLVTKPPCLQKCQKISPQGPGIQASLITRAGRHQVLKWDPFVFVFLGVDLRSYADWFVAS